jgi:UDP-N-acetylglucosamine 2-epimerase
VYASGEWFRVRTIYWNIGVNHEATLASTMGDITLEESINRAALSVMSSIVFANNDAQSDTILNLFNDLKKTVCDLHF